MWYFVIFSSWETGRPKHSPQRWQLDQELLLILSSVHQFSGFASRNTWFWMFIPINWCLGLWFIPIYSHSKLHFDVMSRYFPPFFPRKIQENHPPPRGWGSPGNSALHRARRPSCWVPGASWRGSIYPPVQMCWYSRFLSELWGSDLRFVPNLEIDWRIGSIPKSTINIS